jgi:acyl-CoA-dependent ceramide synthase
MNPQQAPEWLPSFLVPFVALSYPTTTPAVPDSFHNSTHYNTGPLDACFVITCIAVMAVLRDTIRLGVMEPFARWKLMRDLVHSKKIMADRKVQDLPNGTIANGNGHATIANTRGITLKENRKMHRKVLRFAEQGWSVIYYTSTWCYGMVCVSCLDCK